MNQNMNSKQPDSSSTFFISDLHLQQERPDITQAFLQFLATTAKAAKNLYILGDFFEYWIGDDDLDEFKQQIITALKQYTQLGIPVYFMHGNRDFLISKKFAALTGVQLIRDPTLIELNGQKILLMHGDSLCTSDRGHQIFRAFMRNPLTKKFLLSFSSSVKKAVAQFLRRKSVSRNQKLDVYIMDVNPQAVERMMKKYGVKKLIHGHTHRPATHPLEIKGHAAQRIVLGSWHTGANWLEIN